jgi:hypothetical protein
MGMRRTVSLSGAVFALLLCATLVLFVLPAGAQDNGIPPGTPAKGVDTDDNNSPPDVVVVAASDCTVSPGASITLEDYDGTRAIFTDKERGITISAPDGQPRIEGPPGDFVGDHATFPTGDTAFDTDGDYSVVTSTGVTCRGGGTNPTDDQYSDGKTPPPGEVNDPDDVVPGSSTNKKIPPTGGPPLLTLGALMLLSAALVVGRGVLRQ